MKKIITLIALAFTVSVSTAQTTVTKKPLANLDTLVTTTTIVTTQTVKYDTLKYKPVIVVTPYTPSGQVYYSGKNNIIVTGLIIDIKNGGSIAALFKYCNYVHFFNCIIKNSTEDGIQLSNCNNVEIDHCFITNVKAGVNAINCVSVNVHDNQFLNMNGPFPSGNFVQFDVVNGGNCRINNNRCEDIAGVAKHPQDGLSVYKSNGLQTDSIQVIGNWIRGGQVINDSGGGAAIVLGDVGGSYQVARYNVVVNGGFVGMQVQGGTHIKMDHNTIYGAVTPYSNCGLCFGNYSGKASSDINISYNKVKYFKTNGQEMDAWWDPGTAFKPAGWDTNILKASIDATILPSVIITFKQS